MFETIQINGLYRYANVRQMSRTPPSPNPPTDDVSAAIDRYFSAKEYPDPRLALPILQRIAALTTDAIEWFDYKEAELLHRADSDLRRYFRGNFQSSRTQSRRHRSSSVQLSERLDRIESHYDLQRAAVWRDGDLQRARLERRQEKERDSCRTEWERPTTLLKFSKASPALLELREIQRRMTIVMNFIGADELKRQADALELKEAEEAHERAEQAMKIAATHLKRRQERELMILEELIQQKLADVEAEKMKMKAPVEKTLRHMNDSAMSARDQSPVVSRMGDRDSIPPTFRKEAVKRKDPHVQQLPVRPLCADGLFESKRQ
jgi:hypothetical protein